MTFKFKDIGVVPSNPPAGYVGLYCNGGVLYWINSAGATTSIASGTGDLKADGTIPLTANWDVGAFKITANQLESDVASGTAPLIVASTTEVANLTSEWASKGLSLVVAVRNESGAPLTKGKAVYISGYSVGSDIVLVDLARSDSGTTMPCEGIILADIANNATGWMVVNGRIEDVDTSSFSVGDELYIDASTAGALTATEPTGANIPQDVATCLRSHATLGVLEVHVFQARLTAAQIKTQYESNADTNAYDDAAVSKLAGIEAAADVTDATNVAAAGAVMDSDISEAEGFLRKTGAGAYEGIKSNLNASVAPTTTDDSVAGYAVGSQWINTTSDTLYFCLDATASAAVWQEVGAGGGGMTVTTVKTGNYTAAEGEYVPVDSSGGSFIVTLPATPGAQGQVAVVDVGKACSTSPVTVARNGKTIDGAATDFSLDQNNGGAWFMYDGTSDWDTHLEGVPEVVNINDFATGFGGVNAQTGTTYTFADADLAELVTASNAAASTYSIPDSLAAVGETLNVLNIGAGTVTVDCPGTDTLASTANNLATGKAGTIVKTAATTWWLIGGSA